MTSSAVKIASITDLFKGRDRIKITYQDRNMAHHTHNDMQTHINIHK